MKQIPNLITLLNLFFGCCAIALSFNGPDWRPSLFIGLAALVDFLDGFVARMMKASSEMGKQLDSLSDVVSFGVAPSMIILQFLHVSFAQSPGGMQMSWIWLSPAFLFACAVAYRLAKFNIDPEQAYHFKGLPSPMGGLLIASLPLIYGFSSNAWFRSLLENAWCWYGITLITGWLMVSSLPMMALKFSPGAKQQNLPRIILLLSSILALLFLQWLAVPVIFIAYILLSLLFKKRIS